MAHDSLQTMVAAFHLLITIIEVGISTRTHHHTSQHIKRSTKMYADNDCQNVEMLDVVIGQHIAILLL